MQHNEAIQECCTLFPFASFLLSALLRRLEASAETVEPAAPTRRDGLTHSAAVRRPRHCSLSSRVAYGSQSCEARTSLQHGHSIPRSLREPSSQSTRVHHPRSPAKHKEQTGRMAHCRCSAGESQEELSLPGPRFGPRPFAQCSPRLFPI